MKINHSDVYNTNLSVARGGGLNLSFNSSKMGNKKIKTGWSKKVLKTRTREEIKSKISEILDFEAQDSFYSEEKVNLVLDRIFNF